MREPRFTLRERGATEVWDLAMALWRRHPGALLSYGGLGALAGGLLALAAANSLPFFGIESVRAWALLLLVHVVLSPLLFSPLTAWLGEAVFNPAPDRRRVASRWRLALPGLLFAAVLRAVPIVLLLLFTDEAPGLFVLVWMTAIFLAYRTPWCAEILVLEGRGWKAGRRRMIGLSRQAGGLQLGELLIDLVVLLMAGLMSALCVAEIRGWFQDALLGTGWEEAIFNPLASPWPWLLIWPAWTLTITARLISYLGLRSAAEGWEVETRLRLAAESLSASGGGRS